MKSVSDQTFLFQHNTEMRRHIFFDTHLIQSEKIVYYSFNYMVMRWLLSGGRQTQKT